MADDLDDVIRKVRKLVALSESPNPNEAANAMNKARKLLLEHGLTMDNLGKPPSDIADEEWRSFDGLPDNVTGQLVHVVATHNLCSVLLGQGVSEHSWCLVGRPAGIANARALLDYLFAVMDRQSTFACAGRGQKYRYAWRLGWVMALGERLALDRKTESVEERALVIRDDVAIAEYLKELGVTTKKRGEGRDVDMSAAWAGAQAGRAVSLNKQIGPD